MGGRTNIGGVNEFNLDIARLAVAEEREDNNSRPDGVGPLPLGLIGAIKRYREIFLQRHGFTPGLKFSKEAVEALWPRTYRIDVTSVIGNDVFTAEVYVEMSPTEFLSGTNRNAEEVLMELARNVQRQARAARYR